ncbi:hypothetical protein NKJ26_00735 [Mesorhizobium sp. M0152]|uniref:hypothetical protein n=1 Tax=Mesorhizobium sp. M0152 TaxID=2956898 RepID=UPI003338ABCF
MQDTFEYLSRRSGANDDAAFSKLLVESFLRHRIIHAVALFTLGLGFAVGARIGNLPDFALLYEYAFYLVVYFWIFGCGYAAFRLLQLALVDREKSPAKHLLVSFRQLMADRNRIANGVNGLAAILIFVSGFSVLKGAVAVLAPFSWDQAIAQFSTKLHFGPLLTTGFGGFLKARQPSVFLISATISGLRC